MRKRNGPDSAEDLSMNVGCAEIDGEICVNIYSGRDVCITSMTDCIFMIIDADVQKM